MKNYADKLIEQINLVDKWLKSDYEGYAGSDLHCEQTNEIYQILFDGFGWDIDNPDNVKHMQYLSRCTCTEEITYLREEIAWGLLPTKYWINLVD